MPEPDASGDRVQFSVSVPLFLTAKRCSGIIGVGLYWGVAKWQGTGFWSRDRRFESCRPSRRRCDRRTYEDRSGAGTCLRVRRSSPWSWRPARAPG